MPESTDNALIDASLLLANKKRNIRDSAMQELASSIVYNEETNDSLTVIIDRIVDALQKGCDVRQASVAITKTVFAIPTSNAFGAVADQLLKSLNDSSSPPTSRAHIALALGWIAALVGNYSDIYYELPTRIVEGLLDALGAAVVAQEQWADLSLMVTGISAALLGLDQGCVGGWVYNRLVSILLVIIVYYPQSYNTDAGAISDDGAAPPLLPLLQHPANSPVLHALTLLLNAHQACDEGRAEVLFRSNCTNHEEMDEVDDDDEYYYDNESEIFFPEVRYSYEGIKKKLSTLADGECEVPHLDVDGNDVRKFAALIDSVIDDSELPEHSTEAPFNIVDSADVAMFAQSWTKRAAYYCLANTFYADLPAAAVVKAALPSLLPAIEANWYLCSLLDVEAEEEKVNGRSKDKAFLLARKAQNKRRNVVESARRREKYDEVVLADD